MPDEIEEGQPHAIDFFAGEPSPWARVMAWCGWAIQVVEIKLGDSHDLRHEQAHKKWSKKLEGAGAALWAVPCRTLTRIRERPIPGHLNPPRPLRSAEAVRRMEGLPSREQEQVQDGNILIDFSLSEAENLDKRGAAAAIKNPRSGSSLRLRP